MDTDSPTPFDPQRPTPAEHVWLEFRVAMDDLPPAARVAFMLHEVFGATLQEVSSVLGLPPEACVDLVALARACAREHGQHLGWPREAVMKPHRRD